MDENKHMKWVSLVLLTIQNAGVVLLLRYIRTRPGELFSTTTAVVWSEAFKFVLSLLILLYTCSCQVKKFCVHLKENIIGDPWDWLLISVPAVLYVIQNNLIFVAISNLDAATFQVCYQFKLLTTALFFRMLLGKSQSNIQWMSLLILFSGICLVQLQQTNTKPVKTSTAIPNQPVQNPTLGVFVVVVASFMSGFAGVYFEKILKNSSKNVWIRNIQLSVYGVVFGLVTVIFTDRQAVLDNGFFYGYDRIVWIVILIQAIGGLLVAVVINYADNILKGFSTTVAIVLAAAASVLLFDFQPGPYFSIGASFVVVATIAYSSFPYEPTKPKLTPDVTDAV